MQSGALGQLALGQYLSASLIEHTPSGGILVGGAADVSFVHSTAGQVDSNIVVEWDFDNDGDFSESVEDITSYVLSIETMTGRDWPSQLTGKAGPGQLRATLRNDDDRFSYFNNGSPLNASPFNLKTGRKLRVRTTAATNPDPTLLAKDRFNRSNGALGTTENSLAWSGPLANDLTISSNKAVAVSAGNAHIAVVDVGDTDYYAQVKLTEVGMETHGLTGNVLGLVYRYQDSDDYSLAVVDVDAGLLKLINVVAGVSSTVASEAVEPYDNMTIGVLVSSTTVTFYHEGVAVFSGTAIQTDETEVGIYAFWGSSGQSTPALDDFYVWDGLPAEVEGILWTGDLSSLTTTVQPGPQKLATIDGIGQLSRLANQTVSPPSTVEGKKTGILVGNTLALSNMLQPPGPISEGDITTGPFGKGEENALDVARQFEETEFGFLYEMQEGYLGFDSRSARSSVSSSATFSDAGGAQFTYIDISPFDWQREIVNKVIAGVAASTPSGVTITNPSLSGNCAISMPATVDAGDLLIALFALVGGGTGQLRAPNGWTLLYGDASGSGGYAFAKVADGTEDATSVAFSDSAFTFGRALVYRITDWFGSIESGVSISSPTIGLQPLPVFPSWSHQPSLFIVNVHTHGSMPAYGAPLGYTNLNSDGNAGGVGTGHAIHTAYRFGATPVESPSAFTGSSFGTNIPMMIAVRGYNGDPPVNSGVDEVQVEDTDSQDEHNSIRAYRNAPNLFDNTTDATTYANLVLSTYSDDRPIVSLRFVATKNAAYRNQAIRRRVSDKISLVANNNSGLGITAEFFIESIRHRWSHGLKLWETTWELSPA